MPFIPGAELKFASFIDLSSSVMFNGRSRFSCSGFDSFASIITFVAAMSPRKSSISGISGTVFVCFLYKFL